jgi:hypothetical protein
MIAMLWLSGCETTRVEGLLDGVEIEHAVSMFVEEVDVLGDDDLLTVVVSTIPNACRVYEYYLDLYADNPTWRGHSIAWQKALPDEFWEISLYVRVPSIDATLEGAQFNGIPADAELLDSSTVTAELSHFLDHPDPDNPAENGYYDPYLSDGGLLEVARAESGVRVKGTFTTRVVAADRGTPSGDLEIDFDASPCPNVAPFGQP